MRSRCTWLTHTRDYLKQDTPGRKFFKVRKNTNTLELSPTPLPPPYKVKPKTPELLITDASNHSITKSPSISPKIQQLIHSKDSEIQSLNKRYQDLLSRVKKIESTRYIKRNLESLQSAKKIVFPDSSTTSKVSINTRSNSTQSIQKSSLFNSCYYTKNRPKVVLNNPITGLKPNYPY